MSVPDMDLRADAGMAAAALHLLLAQHPGLVELPLGWQIDEDAAIRPFLRVGHPACVRAAQLLATALELELARSEYTDSDDVPMQSLTVRGRWGGAQWVFVAYTYADETAGERS